MEYKILFICLGNICRSPAAEGILKDMVLERKLEHLIQVDSAGLGSWHTGQLPDEHMRRTALKRGYDLTSRARQVRTYDFSAFDMIIAMDDSNYDDLRSLCPDPGNLCKIRRIREFFSPGTRLDHVPDPYYMGHDGFEQALDLLEDACRNLLDHLMSAKGPLKTPSDNV